MHPKSATFVQQKTRRAVPVELIQPTREAFTAWLETRGNREEQTEI